MDFLSLLTPIIIIGGIFLLFTYIRRKDCSKPTEREATLVRKTQNGGVYIFTFDLKGETKTLQTKEAYYDKLQEGETGMLAFRGKQLIDFERYHKR